MSRLSSRARIALALLVCAALALLSWMLTTGGAAIVPDEQYARIVASGVLRVGMDASFPPFESFGADEISGFDADLSRELARRMNLRAEFVTTGYDALYEELAAGHYDVIVSALPYDRLRSQDVAFSDIYFRGGEVLLVRADDRKLAALADLNGMLLGVEYGSNADTLARRLQRRNGYRVQTYTSLADAEVALEAGEVQALLADAVSARLLSRNRSALRIAGEPVGDDPNFVIAMRLSAPTLLATINRHLRAMERDGTMARLMARWF
ncbi:MAG: amino acid ABC transporter substrate-binding protein [Chloroflexi bacterium]|nr:amino acid ABC transporter substrate-binding protein [Chloroflexota bacterium]